MNAALAHILGIVGVVQVRLRASQERGATAVEYGLLVGLIAAVIIAAVVVLGGKLNGYFGAVNTALGGGAAPAAG